MTQTRESGLRP